MTDGTGGDGPGFLGEISRLVEETERPPEQLTPAERIRIRDRERMLLVQEIKHEVLRDLAARRQDRERFLEFLASGIKSIWMGLGFAILRTFAPNRAIEHIESYMREAPFSEKGKAYWTGKSGERMQAQLRRLYRRTRRDR